jgi:colicin import membrane protein
MPPERPQQQPPPPPKPALQEATVEPPVRPKFIDPPTERPKEPEKPKPTRNFDPNSIAKLIGQGKTPTAAPSQTASATPQGLPHHDAPHMSMSMASALDAWLTESYLNCWTPPPGMPDGDTYVAQIKVIFNPDGSLSGRPVLLNPPSDKAWRAHAESAMRAVRKCDPLRVPAEYMPFFDQWKIETIHFDPRETQG